LIFDILEALDMARATRKKLGFGLSSQSLKDTQRILSYVKATEKDSLIKQHVRDVVNNLS
jgi:hypothetical protein